MNQDRLLAQLQVRGIDISQSALSALEGQTRKVTDKELLALTDILKVSLEELFHPPGVEEKR
ncbi:helix-turn-helix transcriptional regulator [Oscillospiraceae bacterium 44-34]|jgi:transcriptional regulator with XRE-family HTH domain